MDGKEDDEQQETTQLNIEEAGNAVTAMLQKIRAMDAAQRCAAVVSTSGRLGYTLLHRAVWLGDARAAAELVEVFNADVNMPAQPSGDTPLHIAARQGHTSLLATLLPLGADPTMRNAAGRSAMDVAAAPCRRHLHGGFQTPPERVVLVGDIHGHLAKLQRLWGNLTAKIGEAEFFSSSTHVVFLGDYVDRGPDIKGVLEWLSTLRQRYPQQSHAFVAGNHDFGMACFLGVPPQPCGDDIASRVLQMVPEVTWAASDPKYQERLYDGPLYETMHLQGRRWCMQHRDHFNATATFQAYGVEYGDAPGLRASVPSAHQMFLQQLELVHECQLPASFPGGATRLLAVHAGLEELQPLQLQLAKLRARDCRDGFLEQLTGRHNVLNLHPGLRQIAADGGEATVLASGHHSRLALDLHRSWNVQLHGHGQRMIVDQCGGIASRSLAAVVLSSSGAEVVEE